MKRAPTATGIGVAVTVALSTFAILWFWSDRSLTQIRNRGVIRIGYAVEAPYAFLLPGGEVTGESPEVARHIVAQLAIRHIEWKQVEFGSLIAGLESSQFDVIAAGMFITPERAQRVAFSDPTFHVREGLLVAHGNPADIHSYQQLLTLADIKIAVIAGAVEETLLRRMGLPADRLVRVPDALAGCVAVESGVVGGMALSSPTIQWMAHRHQLGQTEAAYPFEQPDEVLKERLGFGAFAFRKEDRQLRSAWNAAMRTFIGTVEHRSMVSPFGITEADVPTGITVTEVLSKP